jgi:hypothetical protein
VQEFAPASWYVEEYYDERLLKRHKLERGISVLGRNSSESKRVCDIEPHDIALYLAKSCKVSQNAAVYFVKGEPWLVDVGSTHGTQLLVEDRSGSGKHELQKVFPLSPRRLLDCHRFRLASTNRFWTVIDKPNSFRVVRYSVYQEMNIRLRLQEKGVVEQTKKAKKEKEKERKEEKKRRKAKKREKREKQEREQKRKRKAVTNEKEKEKKNAMTAAIQALHQCHDVSDYSSDQSENGERDYKEDTKRMKMGGANDQEQQEGGEQERQVGGERSAETHQGRCSPKTMRVLDEIALEESTRANVGCIICCSSNAAFMPVGCDHTSNRGCESCLRRLRVCPFCRKGYTALLNVVTQEVIHLKAGDVHCNADALADGGSLAEEANTQAAEFDMAVRCNECGGMDAAGGDSDATNFILLCDAVTHEHDESSDWRPCVQNGQYVPCPNGTHIDCCPVRPWPVDQVKSARDAEAAGDWFCRQCEAEHRSGGYPLVLVQDLPDPVAFLSQ